MTNKNNVMSGATSTRDEVLTRALTSYFILTHASVIDAIEKKWFLNRDW